VPSTIGGLGSTDSVTRNGEAIRTGEFNRFTVQVSPGKNRYLINGQLFYEDIDPSPTSPWLMLMGHPRTRPVFRNVQLTGKPEPLSEVKLISGNYLEGWVAQPHMGNLPKRLHSKEPDPPFRSTRRGT
jgi:Protein of unknown function (DUF1581).